MWLCKAECPPSAGARTLLGHQGHHPYYAALVLWGLRIEPRDSRWPWPSHICTCGMEVVDVASETLGLQCICAPVNCGRVGSCSYHALGLFPSVQVLHKTFLSFIILSKKHFRFMHHFTKGIIKLLTGKERVVRIPLWYIKTKNCE